MKITMAIRFYLLNASVSTVQDTENRVAWETARAEEIAKEEHLPYRERECLILRRNLSNRIDASIFSGARSMNVNVPWQAEIIGHACAVKDLQMLNFFDRLWTPSHGTDLLRLVFVHAVNFNIPLESITEDSVEAYRDVTGTIYRSFDTRVPTLNPEKSDELICMVLSDPQCARNAIAYLEERDDENMGSLMDFLKIAKDGAAALVRGAL